MYVQGFKQIPGVDFDLSYSPTISHGGFRLFIVLSVLTSPYNGAADAIAAYTQSDLPLDEQVWVRKPKKFRKYINGREMASLLGKSLYGLVQSGRNWWLKLYRTTHEDCVWVPLMILETDHLGHGGL
mmetsp:Transcript_25533/g.80577  ORF Transcript_25533/g.80577 Transcript_25533/m.80577 type:complete len:127 (-) Transcript_25533:19-399(-)